MAHDAAQSAFVAALNEPAAAPPFVTAAGGAPPARRLAVYRNNVVAGLIGALERRFPAVRRIVGEECFTAIARVFASAHPPVSPVMMTYGDGFAEFIEAAPGLEDVPYLADVARIEAARTRAYHAADEATLDMSVIEAAILELSASSEADRLGDLVFGLHPSLEIVRSAHPAVTIWAVNAGDAEVEPIERWEPEDAAVMRPDMDVLVLRLPPGGACFLSALARQAPLRDAIAEASSSAAGFDLTGNLTLLMRENLAVSLATDRGALS